MYIATIVDSEIGELYMDGSGNVVFRQRRDILEDTRSAVSQGTFGDQGGTQLPYQAAGRANDDTTLANDIQITRPGGTLQEAQDPASIAAYLFPRSYARSDVLLESDAEALLYAQWVLDVSLTGEDRFDTLTVTPLRDLRLWPHVLGREIGELYVDGSGNVVYRQRRDILEDTRSTVSQGTFGDQGGTQLPYQAAGRANDDTTLANDVQITRAGGTLQEAQDAMSIAAASSAMC